MMGRSRVAMFALCLAVMVVVTGTVSSCAPKPKAPLVSEILIESSELDAEEEAPPLAESDPVKSDEVAKVVTEKEEEDLSNHDFEPALDVKDGTFLSQVFDNEKLDIDKLLEPKNIPITRGKEDPWLDWYNYVTVRTSQEQFDYLKSQGAEIKRKYVWRDSKEETTTSRSDKSRPFERDPYQKIKKQFVEMGYDFIERFYLDIGGNRAPELFIQFQRGTCGGWYYVYQIEPDGYLFVGEIFIYYLNVLHTKSNGFHDLILGQRMGAGDGRLVLLKFDGYEYKQHRDMRVNIDEVDSEFLSTDHPDLLDKDYSNEVLGETFHWSVRDDDKYRWK
jgi:hypothetical protein